MFAIIVPALERNCTALVQRLFFLKRSDLVDFFLQRKYSTFSLYCIHISLSSWNVIYSIYKFTYPRQVVTVV